MERYVEILMTQFAPERLTALLDKMEAELEPEMARHIERWERPKSVKEWKNEVKSLREKLQQRAEIVLEQVRSEFKISKSDMEALIEKYRP